MEFVSDYVIVDIETTGLSPVNNEIIEIGALKVVSNEIVDNFTFLIKPSIALDENIINLTGITNEMLVDASDVYSVLSQFEAFIGDNVLMAHNAKFDISFLNNYYMKYLNKPLSNKYIDTLFLARKYLKLDSYKLGNLANHFNISYIGAHRGLRDCEITKQVYDNLLKIVHINV